jgi:hypothetical protein
MSWCGGGLMSRRPGVEYRSSRSTGTPWGRQRPLARLGALGHLDLEVVGVDEVLRGDTEAARCDLVDRRAPEVAVLVASVAVGVFAALAGVRLSADPVHRDREVLVRFLRDRPVRHRAGGEALHDLRGRLHLVEGDGLAPDWRTRTGREVARLRDWSSTSFVYSLNIPPLGAAALSLNTVSD